MKQNIIFEQSKMVNSSQPPRGYNLTLYYQRDIKALVNDTVSYFQSLLRSDPRTNTNTQRITK